MTSLSLGKEIGSMNPLQSLLDLPQAEREARGVLHTPREIAQQPKTWRSTYERCVAQRANLQTFLRESGVGVRGAPLPTVLLCGAGTSDYVGRALADLLRQRWQCPVWPVPSTDLLTNMETFLLSGTKYLWISFSRSGDSSEGVAVLQKALAAHPEIRHLVVTCNQNGRMAQLCLQHLDRAFALVLDDAVNDRGVAMTSSFSNMVVAGHCLAHLNEAHLNQDHLDEMKDYGERLRSIIDTGTRLLANLPGIASAISAKGPAKACFVGFGPLAAVANESALKLLELTAGRVPTLAESVLGFRHGPLSALDSNTVYTHFVSGDAKRRSYDLDLLAEIRSKRLAGISVAVTPQCDSVIDTLVDHQISLDVPATFPDQYRPPLDVIFAQLLGLFCSLHAGLPPDRPSPNGAISRVVSQVRIY